MKFAALDIGTVTCRLLIADITAHGMYEILRRCEITNLGEGVDAAGRLTPEAIKRVVRQVEDYLVLIDAESCSANAGNGSSKNGAKRMPVVAIATSAARDAANASDLTNALAALGIILRVIPGETEATLSFKGASACFPDELLMVVDIGGGSTEVIFGFAEKSPLFSHSFNLGCRRLTERFLTSDPPTKAELNEAKTYAKLSMISFVQDCLRELSLPLSRVVAVAGTATSVVSIRDHMSVYDPARVHKACVSAQTLHCVCCHLAAQPLALRKQVVGLEPKRASVIVAGMLILEVLLELVHKDVFTVSESDILQGILLEESTHYLLR